MFKTPNFTRAWLALPKYVCWKIWTARNKGLFENLNPSPGKVSSSAKALWAEALLSNGLRHLHLESLNSTEKSWTRDLLCLLKSSLVDAKKPNPLRWQVQKNLEPFSKWWTKLDCHTLFFDGASKENLGLLGVVGILFYSGGTNRKILLGELGGTPTTMASFTERAGNCYHSRNQISSSV